MVVKEFYIYRKKSLERFITVIFPINVSFLCCQLFKIAETSLIFFEKLISVIQFKSKENSIPKSLTLIFRELLLMMMKHS
jgi:hypothetical protein